MLNQRRQPLIRDPSFADFGRSDNRPLNGRRHQPNQATVYIPTGFTGEKPGEWPGDRKYRYLD